ncbi:MAG: hypothetical protein ACI8RD_009671 [Bacillariaceae sp.]|jgi:hypothetical protein
MTTSVDNNNEIALPVSDQPPGLSEMFINSTDTLRQREINQKIPETWNDRPPLFLVVSKRQSFLWRQPKEDTVITEQEDPNLLKGVSILFVYATLILYTILYRFLLYLIR